MRAPLPGPPAGSGRVRSAGRRGFHQTPTRPGRGRTRRLRGAVRDPARASCRPAPAVRIPPFSGRAARELGDRLREAAQQARSRTRIWCAGSSMTPPHANDPAGHDDVERPAPTPWSTPNAGSKPASPSRFRPGFAVNSSSAQRNGRRQRDAIRLAQAVRTGKQFSRRQPAAGPPRAPAAIRLSGGPLQRCSRASDHAAAPPAAAADWLRRPTPGVLALVERPERPPAGFPWPDGRR